MTAEQVELSMTMDQIALRYYMAHKDEVAKLKILARMILRGI
jgi:hypothetical protein